MPVHYRTCPFCEATCGLEVETQGREVVSVRGDKHDVLSGGFICPKAHGLKQLHEDPDRLTTPLVRQGGELVETTWDEAFEEIDRRLAPILAEHGKNSVAVYIGNPSAHNLSALLYGPVWLRALGSQNIYSASTVDQMPKQVSAGLMFGAMLSVPVPDVDRTDHLLILGANPLVSNGSLLTAPDMRGRLRRIRERGGKVVVVDPRRTRTAKAADEHHFIRPGTDALLLAAMACTLVEEGLVELGSLARHVHGLDEVTTLVQDFAPERAAPACGIEAEEIRRMARELAAAPSAAVYARVGTCTQEFGTPASWLVDVLIVLTGNLDRAGGAMFPLAAAGQKNAGGAGGVGRGVRFPSSCSWPPERASTIGPAAAYPRFRVRRRRHDDRNKSAHGARRPAATRAGAEVLARTDHHGCVSGSTGHGASGSFTPSSGSCGPPGGTPLRLRDAWTRRPPPCSGCGWSDASWRRRWSLLPLFWSPWSAGWVGYKAYKAHASEDYDTAIARYRRSIELGGPRRLALENLAFSYQARGAQEELTATLAEIRAADPAAAARIAAEIEGTTGSDSSGKEQN